MLRRNLAPLTEGQWHAIDEEARGVLERTLVARRFVDVEGPHGWEYGAYNLGRLGEVAEDGPVRWSARLVRPLAEVRVPFQLSLWELDNLERGAPEVDLAPVVDAARALARFEERAIYHGLPGANIEGLHATKPTPKALPESPEGILEAVARSMITLSDAGVEGPYVLVLSEDVFSRLASRMDGYPVLRQLEELLGAPPAFSSGVDGAVLASSRGGDFVLCIGVDASIGFDRVDDGHVHLYMTESFTFDVPGAEAVEVFSACANPDAD